MNKEGYDPTLHPEDLHNPFPTPGGLHDNTSKVFDALLPSEEERLSSIDYQELAQMFDTIPAASPLLYKWLNPNPNGGGKDGKGSKKDIVLENTEQMTEQERQAANPNSNSNSKSSSKPNSKLSIKSEKFDTEISMEQIPDIDGNPEPGSGIQSVSFNVKVKQQSTKDKEAEEEEILRNAELLTSTDWYKEIQKHQASTPLEDVIHFLPEFFPLRRAGITTEFLSEVTSGHTHPFQWNLRVKITADLKKKYDGFKENPEDFKRFLQGHLKGKGQGGGGGGREGQGHGQGKDKGKEKEKGKEQEQGSSSSVGAGSPGNTNNNDIDKSDKKMYFSSVSDAGMSCMVSAAHYFPVTQYVTSHFGSVETGVG